MTNNKDYPQTLSVTQEILADATIEGKFVRGVINESGDWESMISIPISEYEELIEIKAMYESLCK